MAMYSLKYGALPVAHATGGVFVHLDARDSGHVDGFARAQHTLGEASDFTVRHAGEVDRHQEGGHLVVGNLAIGVPYYEKLDLFWGQFFAVPFPLNQVNCAHYETLRLTLPKGESKGREIGQMGRRDLALEKRQVLRQMLEGRLNA